MLLLGDISRENAFPVVFVIENSRVVTLDSKWSSSTPRLNKGLGFKVTSSVLSPFKDSEYSAGS